MVLYTLYIQFVCSVSRLSRILQDIMPVATQVFTVTRHTDDAGFSFVPVGDTKQFVSTVWEKHIKRLIRQFRQLHVYRKQDPVAWQPPKSHKTNSRLRLLSKKKATCHAAATYQI